MRKVRRYSTDFNKALAQKKAEARKAAQADREAARIAREKAAKQVEPDAK
jgi:hypothetical protein